MIMIPNWDNHDHYLQALAMACTTPADDTAWANAASRLANRKKKIK